jgi:hypothetical protein
MTTELYKANHLYLMKIALIKTKPKTKLSSSNQQQPTARREQRNRNRRKDKIKKGTHLTLIGVCTTVRPEKSGT